MQPLFHLRMTIYGRLARVDPWEDGGRRAEDGGLEAQAEFPMTVEAGGIPTFRRGREWEGNREELGDVGGRERVNLVGNAQYFTQLSVRFFHAKCVRFCTTE